jgi:predicted ATP-grasp superfamily ATP-dependent carboligase
LSYQGGRIVLEPSQQRPIDLLDSALCALRKPLVENFSNLDLTNVETLGWIGVDLLRDLNGNWIVIEVNPRMTTSVLGLSGASNSNLGQLMIEGFFGTLTRNAGGSLVEINHSL